MHAPPTRNCATSWVPPRTTCPRCRPRRCCLPATAAASGLFGAPDHDVRATRELLGQPAIAGFFCNGEIGPVGGQTFVHGFTASLGLFVAR